MSRIAAYLNVKMAKKHPVSTFFRIKLLFGPDENATFDSFWQGFFTLHFPYRELLDVPLVTFGFFVHSIGRGNEMLTFHKLYETYAADIYRFAYWLTGNAADAEDITSETFIRAWTHLSIIHTETLKAYLLKIARNLYLGQIRKHKNQTELEDIYPDPQPGPSQQVETYADLESVYRILQTLPEIDRAAFVLRVQQELPYAEIARVLNCSEVAVKVKVHRTRKKLLMVCMSEEIL